ncbi:MAG: 4-hydroxy-tetrahydrodipicolinate synthase [Firmicutes bacterium]|nr:4-hydroxy-tetrahydrodipicolinate synthase [Bacillota bacterium]
MNALFTGVATAMVTPFLQGKVNYPMMERLLKRQLEAGVKTAVIAGTTGEGATLTDEEKLLLIRRGKEAVGSQMRILAGTGSNDTAHAAALSAAAQEAGADGLLVVSPYYNKATDEGLVEHYIAIAAAVQIPLIVYNVPSRTGLDIPVEVYAVLSKVPNIAGVKEASSSIEKIAKIREKCPNFPVYAGNDAMVLPVLSLGGAGVISTAANVAPVPMQALCSAAADGDFDTAEDLQLHLLPLICALFAEVNPIPVKAAMRLLGFDCGSPRLPLTPAMESTVRRLRETIENSGCAE